MFETNRCGERGKVTFTSRAKAKKAAKSLGDKHGAVFSVYLCEACGRYHLKTRRIAQLSAARMRVVNERNRIMATATKDRKTERSAQPLPPISIDSIEAQNVGGIPSLDLKLGGQSLVVSGSNAQCKSTALKTILIGLGQMGDKEFPEGIRKGEDHAWTKVRIRNALTGQPLFLVERECEENHWTPITVTDLQTKEDRKRPQEFVDSFITRVCQRPFDWLDERAVDQIDSVLRIVNVPLPGEAVKEITGMAHDPIGDETAHGYMARLCADKTGEYFKAVTVAGRAHDEKYKGLVAFREEIDALPELPADDTAGMEELQGKRAGLYAKLEQRRALEAKWNRERPLLQAQVTKAQELLDENQATADGLPHELELAEFQVKGTEAEIARLQKRLVTEKEACAKVKARMDGAAGIISENRADLETFQKELAAKEKAARAAVDAIPDPAPQIATIDAKLLTIGQRQEAIADRRVKETLFERLRTEEQEAAAAHELAKIRLNRLRELRAHMLDGVDLGVENLTVGDGGLRLNDLPFKEHASTAQQGTVAYKVAKFRNPSARFMFGDNAEKFDAITRATILRMAKEDGIQLLLAVVRDEACPKCKGAGAIIETGHDPVNEQPCDNCAGTGRVNSPRQFQIVG